MVELKGNVVEENQRQIKSKNKNLHYKIYVVETQKKLLNINIFH